MQSLVECVYNVSPAVAKHIYELQPNFDFKFRGLEVLVKLRKQKEQETGIPTELGDLEDEDGCHGAPNTLVSKAASLFLNSKAPVSTNSLSIVRDFHSLRETRTFCSGEVAMADPRISTQNATLVSEPRQQASTNLKGALTNFVKRTLCKHWGPEVKHNKPPLKRFLMLPWFTLMMLQPVQTVMTPCLIHHKMMTYPYEK